VALSGLGGDELFAGYPSFRRALRLRQLAAIPPAIRKGSAAVGRSALSNSSRRQKFWRMVASDCSAHAAYIISRELFSAADIQNLSPRLTCVAASIDRDGGGDAVNAMSNYELHGYMANTLLRDTDQMSMAHGLEVRVPFVDRELTKYVLSLPGAWKVAGQRPKPLLLDALSGLIPESIWRRPKMGFTLPFERWLATTLRPAMESTLDRAEGRTAQGLRRQAVQLVWRTFLQNPRGEPWSRPWSLYVLDRWCEINQIEA
jgi:asparagine synthase (glutamine-hydrolysing)